MAQTKNPRNLDERVGVTDADTTSKYLNEKIVAGTNITTSILNPGGDEKLQINATGLAGLLPLEDLTFTADLCIIIAGCDFVTHA